MVVSSVLVERVGGLFRYPPPSPLKVCKVFESETLALDLIGVKYLARFTLATIKAELQTSARTKQTTTNTGILHCVQDDDGRDCSE
jgi:hypothetical protein